jgi:pseudouridine-5'-phosphate glycosidase
MAEPPPIVIFEEVRVALAAGRPVVALESSIVAHGFPPPANRTLADELHAAARAEGAVPAMAAVIDGEVRLGLDEAALDRLAAGGAMKCSARDLAFCRGDGGTTVAATARIAAAAGVRIFATGGIGGVHRGALDVSADLPELARAPVAVVSSGAKSILDLPATLEALDALGVPVLGFRCSVFPAFHTADSGLALKHRFDDEAALARALTRHWALPGAGGALICNPPPADDAMARDEIEELVRRALAEAAEARGDRATPAALAALDRLSGGRTTVVNRALALANARLGARLACALSRC